LDWAGTGQDGSGECQNHGGKMMREEPGKNRRERRKQRGFAASNGRGAHHQLPGRAMSYLTVEVEIDHGRVSPKGPKLCRRKRPACSPSPICRPSLSRVPPARRKGSSPCRMTSTPHCRKTCCRRSMGNEDPAASSDSLVRQYPVGLL